MDSQRTIRNNGKIQNHLHVLVLELKRCDVIENATTVRRYLNESQFG